jgi:predicted acylesterase/phospholipase RssA
VAIEERRRAQGQTEAEVKRAAVAGLALSGGGIRSASVCLGVLQALNHHRLLSRIDYLSTVSGGGYIGCALTASTTVAHRFVFGDAPAARGCRNSRRH